MELDLLIVGAGPAGISTAVEAREAGIAADKIAILEKGPLHSYAIRKFYPDDKRVDAVYKGIPAISEGRITLADGSKQETLDFLGDTIRQFELNVRYEEGVDSILKLDGNNSLQLFNLTHTSGTVALRMDARAESIDCSPIEISVNGITMLITLMTSRCPYIRRVRGSSWRASATTIARNADPNSSRPAISSNGVRLPRPILIQK